MGLMPDFPAVLVAPRSHCRSLNGRRRTNRLKRLALGDGSCSASVRGLLWHGLDRVAFRLARVLCPVASRGFR